MFSTCNTLAFVKVSWYVFCMTPVLQSIFVVAALSILWRSTLNKKPHLRDYLKKLFPFFLGTALTCGLCFTFWTTLGFVVFYNPLPIDFFVFNSFANEHARFLSHLFLSWMCIGTPALFVRFLFALLQEEVNFMNEKNGNGHHHHHKHG